ncbi:MAG: serine/threonine protein kinase [Peltula sp. TS41687]|nr:MAG: serine/threonine protein kinase [Peltula sp. TS41687]
MDKTQTLQLLKSLPKTYKSYRLHKELLGDNVIGAEHTVSGEELAVKICEGEGDSVQRLECLVKTYRSLAGGVGIPFVHDLIKEAGYAFMLFSLHGPSLKELLGYCHGRFTMTTVLQLALQLLKRIQFIHEHSLLHQAIKPGNFLVGLGKWGCQVQTVNFGLPRLNAIPGDLLLYASINAHTGAADPCRFDDLESLGYMLLHFANGELPWNATSPQRMLEMKRGLVEQPGHLDRSLGEFFEYIRSADRADKPDYTGLYEKWLDDLDQPNSDLKDVPDWIIRKTVCGQRRSNSGCTVEDIEWYRQNRQIDGKTLVSISTQNNDHEAQVGEMEERLATIVNTGTKNWVEFWEVYRDWQKAHCDFWRSANSLSVHDVYVPGGTRGNDIPGGLPDCKDVPDGLPVRFWERGVKPAMTLLSASASSPDCIRAFVRFTFSTMTLFYDSASKFKVVWARYLHELASWMVGQSKGEEETLWLNVANLWECE